MICIKKENINTNYFTLKYSDIYVYVYIYNLIYISAICCHMEFIA